VDQRAGAQPKSGGCRRLIFFAMPKALILYHYFHPDDVVSATHLSELAEGLARRGWQVTAMPCNRGCRDEKQKYSRRELWNGVSIRRVWRPNFRQPSSAGRILNALWMIAAWSLAALKQKPDVVIVGTDPIMSVTVALFWKLLRPKTRVAHWCFDLYPEAAVADGVLGERSLFLRLLRGVLRRAYTRCDLIADIGDCMRSRIKAYAPSANFATLTPWALAEPESPLNVDSAERAALFGDAELALMYSGSFGRAHSYAEILELMARLRKSSIKLAFSVRGNREPMLRQAVAAADVNVSFCEFAPVERLEARLSAADIHVVSLHPEWTGTVVPSKFFGAIAAGRPVLFAGSPESAVAKWIQEYGLGWVLTPRNVQSISDQLIGYASSSELQLTMRRHCFEVYHRYFCREKVIFSFNQAISRLLAECDSTLIETTRSAKWSREEVPRAKRR
jgi:colanic acid biosynthesis glycosyl transferase WcaI